MLFKKRRLILVLSVVFCMLFSSIPVYAINSASSGSSQRFHSSGHGSGGAPQPGSVAHVYFDDGPKDPASGTYPKQGYMTRDHKWHNNHGTVDNDYTYKYYMNLLDKVIEDQANVGSLKIRYNKKFNGNSAYPKFKEVLDQAAQRALQRDQDAQYARIVGVALTYRLTPDKKGWNIADSMSGTQHATSWDRLWSNHPSKRTPDYPDRSEFTYTNEGGEQVWFQVAQPDDPNFGRYAGTTNGHKTVLAEALYKRSKADSDLGDNNGMYIVIYAIAVTENEPDNPTPVRFHKHSNNMSITDGNAQYSVANAEFTVTNVKSNKVEGVVTSNADGYTDYVNLYPGDYKVVETVSPKGYAGYSITHYIHVGEDGDVVNEEGSDPLDEDTATYGPFEDTSEDGKLSIVYDETKSPRELAINITEENWNENWWLMELKVDNEGNLTLLRNTNLTNKTTSTTISDDCDMFAIVQSADEPAANIQDGISYALNVKDQNAESDENDD